MLNLQQLFVFLQSKSKYVTDRAVIVVLGIKKQISQTLIVNADTQFCSLTEHTIARKFVSVRRDMLK